MITVMITVPLVSKSIVMSVSLFSILTRSSTAPEGLTAVVSFTIVPLYGKVISATIGGARLLDVAFNNRQM